jgi:hypothetical protein
MCRILLTFVFAGQGIVFLAQNSMVSIEAILPITSFSLLMLTVTLYGLSASGHFPRASVDTLNSPVNVLILYGTIVIVLLCLMAGLWTTWWLIPWHVAVIAGGLAILAAPPVLQRFPDNFVDGSRSLLSFCGASAGLAIVLLLFVANGVVPR